MANFFRSSTRVRLGVGAGALRRIGVLPGQAGALRRIGVLPGQAATDSVSQARNAAFLQGLQELGWMIGRNVEIEYRWAPGDVDNSRRNAEDLVALAPDVILATGGVNMGPLLQVTRTIPIVFVQVTEGKWWRFRNRFLKLTVSLLWNRHRLHRTRV